MIGWRLAPVGLVILLSAANESFAVDQSWYFTAGEIKITYRYQQSFGRRLRHPLKPQDCYFGKTEITISASGKLHSFDDDMAEKPSKGPARTKYHLTFSYGGTGVLCRDIRRRIPPWRKSLLKNQYTRRAKPHTD